MRFEIESAQPPRVARARTTAAARGGRDGGIPSGCP